VILKISVENDISDKFDEMIFETKRFNLISEVTDDFIKEYTCKLEEGTGIKNKSKRIDGIRNFFVAEENRTITTKFITTTLTGNDYTSINYIAYERFLSIPSLF
jgi:hypothetical protein